MPDDRTVPTPATPAAPAEGRTAILVAAFDSQLKWAGAIRRALQDRGFHCQVIVPSDIRHAVSDAQLADYSGSEMEYLPWDDIVERGFEVDAVVLALHGPLVSRFTHELFDAVAASGRRPPVTISGWVGVIIEKITSGYLERYATDLVAVNSRSDLRTFRAAAGSLELPTGNLLLSGLPLLTGEHRVTPAQAPIRSVMFADQPTVPHAKADRLYLYEQLIAYARAHPDRSVVLKPRHRIGEDTFHPMKYHPEMLLEGIERPANFSIDYAPISQRLADGDLELMMTVSSTAALEAIGAGVRTAFIADLDVREQLGNHIFLDSGLLRTFDQVRRDEIGTPNEAWIGDYFFATDDRSPAEQIADRALELVQDPERTAPVGWTTPFFASQHRLYAYRKHARGTVGPAISGWAARARPVAQWVLPYGVQLQLRRSLNLSRNLKRLPANQR